MNAPLTVGFGPGSASLARGLVASLSQSFRVAGNRPADLTMIEGSIGWAARTLAAIDDGAPGLFVMEPVLDDIQALRRLADRVDGTKTQVVVSEGYADNPTLSGFREWMARDFDVLALCGWGEPSLPTLVLSQLRILRAIGMHSVEFADVLAGSDAALVIGKARLDHCESLLRLRATRSAAGPPQQTLIAHASDASARIDLFDGATARPAQASLTTSAGLHCLPTLYESAHRVRLRSLAQGKTWGLAGDFQRFVDDAELVMSMFS